MTSYDMRCQLDGTVSDSLQCMGLLHAYTQSNQYVAYRGFQMFVMRLRTEFIIIIIIIIIN